MLNLSINKKNLPNLFFWILIIVNSYPIVFNQYFLTLDGPAHLYNAKLVLQVLFEKNELLNYFYDFNTYPEPNLTGHVLMELLLTVFPPWLSEKTIQLIYIFGFPLSFYYLLKGLNKDLGFKYIYFFPFIYAFTFVIGFYNYCLSLILFFICLSLWNSYLKNQTSNRIFALALCLLLLYFSHALVFLFCVLTITTVSISWSISNPIPKWYKSIFLKIALVSWPGLILIVSFLFNKRDVNEVYFIPFNELVKWVYTLKPVVAYGKIEVILTTILFVIYLISAIAKLIHRVKTESFRINFKSDSYLLLFLVFGVLIFVIPDKLASGGYVTMRLIMFTFFFLTIWICAQTQKNWIDTCSLIIILGIVSALNFRHFNGYAITNKEIKEQQSCLSHIKPNSTLLPLNYSKHWLQSNMSNYLGTEFPLFILDNYEASHKPFQLHWKKNRNPYELVGSFAGHPPLCANISNFETVTQKSIDYIMTWKMPPNLNDSCTNSLRHNITNDYDTVFVSHSKKLVLFEKRVISQF